MAPRKNIIESCPIMRPCVNVGWKKSGSESDIRAGLKRRARPAMSG